MTCDNRTELLRGDLEWVEAQPRTLERDHLAGLLRWMMDEKKPGSRDFYLAMPEPEPHA